MPVGSAPKPGRTGEPRPADPVLALADEVLETDPGSPVGTRVTVRNVGSIVAQYRVEVLGPAARWSDVVPPRISVLPGAEQTVDVLFRPPPAPHAPVGTIPFGVRSVSLEDPDVAGVAEGDVVVGAVKWLDVSVRPEGARGVRAGRYRVELHNVGTEPLDVRLAAADPAGLLRFVVAPQHVTVPAGKRAVGYVAVQPRTPLLLGKPLQHAFTVTYGIGTAEDAGRFPLTYQQRPRITKTMVVVALLIAAALLAAYLWLRSLGAAAPLTTGSPPGVTLESVESGEGTVRVVWSRSPYATGYEVEERTEEGQVNDVLPVDTGDKTSFAGDREPGRYCYRVRPVVDAGNETMKGLYSDAMCVDVAAQPTPTATPTPTDGATPEPSGPAVAQFEPERWYVLFGGFAIDDAANVSAAYALARDLQAAGATGVQVKDSRGSVVFHDGSADAGLLVVFKDDFPTEAEAVAECARFQEIAKLCLAQEAP
jgi:hypothetical protein